MSHTPAAAVLAALNEEQHAAAIAGGAPTLVVAGPGTGKTTTLAGRYAHELIQGASPAAIIVSTFTKKAAEELVDRISARCQISLAGAPIGTLHALAARILRKNWQSASLPSPNFTILSESDVIARLRPLKGKASIDLAEVAGQISSWKDQLVDAGTPQARRDNPDAARFYAAYQKACCAEGLLDFGDLIARTVSLLENDDRLRERISSHIRSLMIDEYQDVNLAQYRFIRALLNADTSRLWAVGDPDQAIFEWRSADPSYLTRFKTYFPDGQVLGLSANYRSIPMILNAANGVISHNRNRVPMSLRAAGRSADKKGSFVLAAQPNVYAEADFIANGISTMLKAGVPATEIAILFRSAWIASMIQYALARRGIPFHLRGTGGFASMPEARVFIRLLTAGQKQGDAAAAEALSRDPLGAHLRSRLPLVAGPLPKAADAAARAVLNIMPKGAGEDRRVMWRDTVAALAQVAHDAEDIDDFLAQTEAAAGNDAVDSVTLLSIHAAKGLEWDAVYLAGFEDGVLPNHKAVDQGNLEEERRLLYVAITRARHWFTATWARERGNRGGGPSCFLDEVRAACPDAKVVGDMSGRKKKRPHARFARSVTVLSS